MAWSDYWGALSSRQRTSLLVISAVVVGGMACAAAWLLNDPWVPLEHHLTSERVAEVTQALERAKLDYRVGADGESVTVPRSELGKAHAAEATGPSTVPPGVGLELFKETDFSSTDFAQRINYQRALQGELARTIQGVSGVRAVRVHVILADAGLFKRDAAKASAAVSVSMQGGRTLGRAQVRGIQRLVAASVPEIKVDDVVVLDESGVSLTRATSEADGDPSSSQLDMKRQVDEYLEGKLQRLLQDLVPHGVASLSVDADLDPRQLRVTTEQPLAAAEPKGDERPAGVLLKEHQSQHSRSTATPDPGHADAATDPDSSEWEGEYKVGHRLEQMLSTPGSLRRLSVAVMLQGAPSSVTAAEVEKLVGHAIGIEPARGDSVDVLMLAGGSVTAGIAGGAVAPVRLAREADSPPTDGRATQWNVVRALAAALFVILVGALLATTARARRAIIERQETRSLRDLDATVARVRQWLAEEKAHAGG